MAFKYVTRKQVVWKGNKNAFENHVDIRTREIEEREQGIFESNGDKGRVKENKGDYGSGIVFLKRGTDDMPSRDHPIRRFRDSLRAVHETKRRNSHRMTPFDLDMRNEI